jgi:transcriptional regulator of acetoin/glycerol metabolism
MLEIENAATATGRRGAPVTVLRWVYPDNAQLTILADQRVVLGRDSASTTRLDSDQVSRKHAALSPGPGGHVVEDLGSKNGLFVNARRIRRAPLAAGDVLRVGDFLAVVEKVPLSELPGYRPLGCGIFGGAALARALAAAQELALHAPALLVTGESGSGKELFARALHQLSEREGLCVTLDCRAAQEPPELSGCLRAAAGGTLVLKDVNLLGQAAQARVLAALAADTLRLIATSRCSLGEPAARGLAPELRARLGAAVIALPPLRERRADIVPSFQRFLERQAPQPRPAADPELLEQLCLRSWPLNLSELDDLAQRLLARYALEPELRLEHLRALDGQPAEPSPAHSRPPLARRSSTPYSPDDVQGLNGALERHRGNLTKAAAELGITRAKAYRMLGGVRVRH